MREETIAIPIKDLECLQRHLNEAFNIFKGLGIEDGAMSAPSKARKKVPFGEGVANYRALLESGAKRTFPKHLNKTKNPKTP